MILRKLAGAIREQNWFTAGLEILIVVTGIFIGLQADDWNQSRKDNERAQQAIEELRLDFVSINEAADELATYYKTVIDDLQILMGSLHAGRVEPEEQAAIKNAIAYGDNFGDPPPPSGTFLDLMSAGNLALIRDKELRLRLIEYDQSLDNIADSDANINNALAQFSFAFKRHAIMEASFHVPESTNLDFVDVVLPAVSEVNYEAMLADPAFRVAAEQHFRLQIGRYVNVRVSQSKIAQVQKLIDQNLGTQSLSTVNTP